MPGWLPALPALPAIPARAALRGTKRPLMLQNGLLDISFFFLALAADVTTLREYVFFSYELTQIKCHENIYINMCVSGYIHRLLGSR